MNKGRITSKPQVFVIADSQSVVAAKSILRLVGTSTILGRRWMPLDVKNGGAV